MLTHESSAVVLPFSQQTAPAEPSHNGRVALRYAAAGFYVFPCSAERQPHTPSDRLPFGKADKRPLVSSWSKKASRGETQIRIWWTRNPEALVGLPCKQNRLFVIDTDRHTAEEDGVAALATLCEGRDEPMPAHPVVITDYGGEHHIFWMPDEPIGQGKNRLPPGVDVRGYRPENDGGYIIAAGSRMPDGRGWRRMEGTPSLRDVLPLPPAWLIELCRPPQVNTAPMVEHKPSGKAEEAYALAALDRAAAELASMKPSTGRDNKLLSVAGTMGRMIAPGWIGQATVEGRLFDACRANGLAGDTGDAAILDKIKRGIEATVSNPHPPLPERHKGNGKATAEIGGTMASLGERSIVAIRADTLKPESISWAWKNRFAFGKLAVIAGDPGLGKSTVLVDIAARHTRGTDFPCGEGRAVQCEVAILTAEDGLTDTLIPRLMAAEADMSKVHFITGTKPPDGGDEAKMFDVASDVIALRAYLTANPNIKVLIIDPLTAYLGAGTKAKENTDVRRVLAPLVKLADDFRLLIIANNHLNKGSGKALYRILDSIAFAALGRIIHLVIEDADNRENRKFICSKSNIGSKPLGLTYLVHKTWITGDQGEEIETSVISWGTQYIDETADEALGGEDEAPTMADEAEKFVREILLGGRAVVEDITAEARTAGLLGSNKEIRHSKPFRTACERLGVIHDREGFGPGAKYYWRLP